MFKYRFFCLNNRTYLVKQSSRRDFHRAKNKFYKILLGETTKMSGLTVFNRLEYGSPPA